MSALGFDLVIIGIYFAIIIGIGVYFSRRNKDVSEFALGGRSIPWWAVLASILASEISAGTFFGSPGEGFESRNYLYAQLMIGYLLARLVVSGLFIPAFYKHNVVSIYEFLEIRFGPKTRSMASVIFLITRSLASGSRLWVPTLLLIVMWNRLHPGQPLDSWEQFWLTGGALLVITLMTAAYTAVGGIKAVIWTDVLQIAVLFGALGFSVWYLLGHIPGGWEGAKSYLGKPTDLIFWKVRGDVPPTPEFVAKYGVVWGEVKSVLQSSYNIWAAFLGSLFVTLATHGTDQDMVQRMLTAKNKRQSAVATILSGIADIPVTYAVLTIGILLSVYYGHIANDPNLPMAGGKPDSSMIFPYFVVDVMPGGLRGLVIAGVLATTMGSLGTAMNSLATSYSRDFHFRWFKTPEDDNARVRIIKLSTVGFALILILVGLATAFVKAHNPSLSIIPIILGSFGYTYGALLGVFIVALFTKNRGSEIGNLIAMTAGIVVVAVLSDLPNDVWSMFTGDPNIDLYQNPEWMPVLKFTWRILAGTLVTVAVALCFKSDRTRSATAR
ncbi:sodium:solute symporter [Luteolibacter yonseiensis]|uniref:Sodium:solute symporter n=1 Tax=Luteolibacter yonseiensis TaxID=1144680 RepID=A0A934R701_9BACT|nr:sodium:solute symporter [Luteolibacter yonseiensis]MBK1816274.1 sodium:solute symporter [Luteolibacter yonseiensis]